MIAFRILYESVLQAWQQLSANRLRTLLSLLGITIGIFSIISILAAVDSLENEVLNNFSKLGDDVVYVSREPWNEHPGSQYWKYLKRPYPGYEDYQALKASLDGKDEISLFTAMSAGNITYMNNSLSNIFVMPVTFEYDRVFPLNIARGRYFNNYEYERGSNSAIIGYDVASSLFGNADPIGKIIKIKGLKYEVIGVFEEEGQSLINVIPYDQMIMLTWTNGKKLINYKSRFFSHFLAVKAGEDRTMQQLKDDITIRLRAERRLKPMEENNFELNEISILANALERVFGILSLAGMLIGGFAILVGMFSVANIMFVSVNERIKIIGIKKALGAPSYVILMEFLIEAIVLCVIGGIAGLILVYITMAVVNNYASFEMFLSAYNILLGIGLSALIGVLAGFIPAFRASRMDPVDAIRH